jgi:PfaD family protein
MTDKMSVKTAGTAGHGLSDAEVDLAFEPDEIRARLLNLGLPVVAVRSGDRIGLANLLPGQLNGVGGELFASTPALNIDQLGDPAFRAAYGVKYAYYAGAMANAIASTEMVIALGRAGFLGSFGAAGLVGQRLETAIQQLQAALPEGPYAVNLIHNHHDESLERKAAELFVRYGVPVVETSAFLDMTAAVVHYRAAGLSLDAAGQIVIGHRIIAKLSRTEIATKFMEPAPDRILAELVAEGKITQQQANLARQVPVADDVTVEADSGGHTDNRPLVCLLPTMLALRDEIQARYQYATPIRVGAGGGISTPHSALGAFMMGAAYVVTGSVNQACVEAGTCDHTRGLLAKAGMADITMAPSADMFEMGVKVQVLKAGTLFPMRAQKLYDVYMKYPSIEEIPAEERQKLERQIFNRSLDDVWAETVKFFQERDPEQIVKANANPKRKMALIFRWYLGLSSRWSNGGEKGREMDYQIWCGPSMGAFNDWVRGSYLDEAANRRVEDVARQILTGCAYLYRLQSLKLQGLQIPSELEQYRPAVPLA